MNIAHLTLTDPMLFVPLVVFLLVFGLATALMQRPSVASLRLARHRTSADGATLFLTAPSVSSRRSGLPRLALPARLLMLFDGEKNAQADRQNLNRAGQPISLEAYRRLRSLFTFVLTPLLGVLVLIGLDQPLFKIASTVIILVAIPRLPVIWLKRKAKKRGREMDKVMADVLDLLVVCVEGGQSLQAAIAQVATRMENIAAEEFRHLLSDINSGMSRRDAFLALADRCQSESLGIVCTTIVQADKIGMGIARTLRTLSDTMRTRRRQAAESKARQAPIKMMPVLVGFMLPAMLALLLGPVALQVMEAFN